MKNIRIKYIILIIICSNLMFNANTNANVTVDTVDTDDTGTNIIMQNMNMGGALRYNVITEFYASDYEILDTYITSDTWLLNVNGSKKGIDLSIEYRFYPSFGTHFIHHGYFGFYLFDSLYTSPGVSQVPFGVTGYASHSWRFLIF